MKLIHEKNIKVTALVTAVLFLTMDLISFPSQGLARSLQPGLEITDTRPKVSIHPEALRLREDLGTVLETFQGKGAASVILIQDAHAIPDAQYSIQRLIGYFQKEYGIQTVAVEGAAAKLDPQIFRSFPDKDLLRKVLRTYHERGELTGATAAAIFNEGGTEYRGIEDWKLYEEGLRLYQEAMKAGPEIGKGLKQEAERQEAEKKKIYNEKLYAVDRALEAFHGDHANLLETLKTLAAVKRPEAGSELEVILKEGERAKETSEKDRRAGLNKQDDSRAGLNKQDDSRAGLNLPYKGVSAEGEVKQLAAKVLASLKALPESKAKQAKLAKFNSEAQKFSTGQVTAHAYGLFLEEVAEREKIALDLSSHLTGLIGDARKMRDIKGTRFFDAFEAYARSVKESLYKNEEEKALDQAGEQLSLFKRLLDLELSREDWEEIKREQLRIKNEELRIENNRKKENSVFNSSFSIINSQLYPSHFAFYQNAEARDEAFFKNIKALCHPEQSEGSLSKILLPLGRDQEDGHAKSVILIAGGFHSEGLTTRLKEAGISYALVMPKIGTVPEHSAYLDQMQGLVSWKDYYEAEQGKISVYKAFVRYVRDQLVNEGRRAKGEGRVKENSSSLVSHPSSFSKSNAYLLKRWRDRIIFDLADQKRIVEAGNYTQFIDEIRGVEPLPADLLAKMNRLNKFIDGLKKLEIEERITPENILALLQPSTIVAGDTALVLVPAARLVPSAGKPVRAVPRSKTPRAEVRNIFDQPFERQDDLDNAIGALPNASLLDDPAIPGQIAEVIIRIFTDGVKKYGQRAESIEEGEKERTTGLPQSAMTEDISATLAAIALKLRDQELRKGVFYTMAGRNFGFPEQIEKEWKGLFATTRPLNSNTYSWLNRSYGKEPIVTEINQTLLTALIRSVVESVQKGSLKPTYPPSVRSKRMSGFLGQVRDAFSFVRRASWTEIGITSAFGFIAAGVFLTSGSIPTILFGAGFAVTVMMAALFVNDVIKGLFARLKVREASEKAMRKALIKTTWDLVWTPAAEKVDALNVIKGHTDKANRARAIYAGSLAANIKAGNVPDGAIEALALALSRVQGDSDAAHVARAALGHAFREALQDVWASGQADSLLTLLTDNLLASLPSNSPSARSAKYELGYMLHLFPVHLAEASVASAQAMKLANALEVQGHDGDSMENVQALSLALYMFKESNVDAAVRKKAGEALFAQLSNVNKVKEGSAIVNETRRLLMESLNRFVTTADGVSEEILRAIAKRRAEARMDSRVELNPTEPASRFQLSGSIRGLMQAARIDDWQKRLSEILPAGIRELGLATVAADYFYLYRTDPKAPEAGTHIPSNWIRDLADRAGPKSLDGLSPVELQYTKAYNDAYQKFWDGELALVAYSQDHKEGAPSGDAAMLSVLWGDQGQFKVHVLQERQTAAVHRIPTTQKAGRRGSGDPIRNWMSGGAEARERNIRLMVNEKRQLGKGSSIAVTLLKIQGNQALVIVDWSAHRADPEGDYGGTTGESNSQWLGVGGILETFEGRSQVGRVVAIGKNTVTINISTPVRAEARGAVPVRLLIDLIETLPQWRDRKLGYQKDMEAAQRFLKIFLVQKLKEGKRAENVYADINALLTLAKEPSARDGLRQLMSLGKNIPGLREIPGPEKEKPEEGPWTKIGRITGFLIGGFLFTIVALVQLVLFWIPVSLVGGAMHFVWSMIFRVVRIFTGNDNLEKNLSEYADAASGIATGLSFLASVFAAMHFQHSGDPRLLFGAGSVFAVSALEWIYQAAKWEILSFIRNGRQFLRDGMQYREPELALPITESQPLVRLQVRLTMALESIQENAPSAFDGEAAKTLQARLTEMIKRMQDHGTASHLQKLLELEPEAQEAYADTVLFLVRALPRLKMPARFFARDFIALETLLDLIVVEKHLGGISESKFEEAWKLRDRMTRVVALLMASDDNVALLLQPWASRPATVDPKKLQADAKKIYQETRHFLRKLENPIARAVVSAHRAEVRAEGSEEIPGLWDWTNVKATREDLGAIREKAAEILEKLRAQYDGSPVFERERDLPALQQEAFEKAERLYRAEHGILTTEDIHDMTRGEVRSGQAMVQAEAERTISSNAKMLWGSFRQYYESTPPAWFFRRWGSGLANYWRDVTSNGVWEMFGNMWFSVPLAVIAAAFFYWVGFGILSPETSGWLKAVAGLSSVPFIAIFFKFEPLRPWGGLIFSAVSVLLPVLSLLYGVVLTVPWAVSVVRSGVIETQRGVLRRAIEKLLKTVQKNDEPTSAKLPQMPFVGKSHPTLLAETLRWLQAGVAVRDLKKEITSAQDFLNRWGNYKRDLSERMEQDPDGGSWEAENARRLYDVVSMFVLSLESYRAFLRNREAAVRRAEVRNEMPRAKAREGSGIANFIYHGLPLGVYVVNRWISPREIPGELSHAYPEDDRSLNAQLTDELKAAGWPSFAASFVPRYLMVMHAVGSFFEGVGQRMARAQARWAMRPQAPEFPHRVNIEQKVRADIDALTLAADLKEARSQMEKLLEYVKPHGYLQREIRKSMMEMERMATAADQDEAVLSLLSAIGSLTVESLSNLRQNFGSHGLDQYDTMNEETNGFWQIPEERKREIQSFLSESFRGAFTSQADPELKEGSEIEFAKRLNAITIQLNGMYEKYRLRAEVRTALSDTVQALNFAVFSDVANRMPGTAKLPALMRYLPQMDNEVLEAMPFYIIHPLSIVNGDPVALAPWTPDFLAYAHEIIDGFLKQRAKEGQSSAPLETDVLIIPRETEQGNASPHWMEKVENIFYAPPTGERPARLLIQYPEEYGYYLYQPRRENERSTMIRESVQVVANEGNGRYRVRYDDGHEERITLQLELPLFTPVNEKIGRAEVRSTKDVILALKMPSMERFLIPMAQEDVLGEATILEAYRKDPARFRAMAQGVYAGTFNTDSIRHTLRVLWDNGHKKIVRAVRKAFIDDPVRFAKTYMSLGMTSEQFIAEAAERTEALLKEAKISPDDLEAFADYAGVIYPVTVRQGRPPRVPAIPKIRKILVKAFVETLVRSPQSSWAARSETAGTEGEVNRILEKIFWEARNKTRAEIRNETTPGFEQWLETQRAGQEALKQQLLDEASKASDRSAGPYPVLEQIAHANFRRTQEAQRRETPGLSGDQEIGLLVATPRWSYVPLRDGSILLRAPRMPEFSSDLAALYEALMKWDAYQGSEESERRSLRETIFISRENSDGPYGVRRAETLKAILKAKRYGPAQYSYGEQDTRLNRIDAVIDEAAQVSRRQDLPEWENNVRGILLQKIADLEKGRRAEARTQSIEERGAEIERTYGSFPGGYEQYFQTSLHLHDDSIEAGTFRAVGAEENFSGNITDILTTTFDRPFRWGRAVRASIEANLKDMLKKIGIKKNAPFRIGIDLLVTQARGNAYHYKWQIWIDSKRTGRIVLAEPELRKNPGDKEPAVEDPHFEVYRFLAVLERLAETSWMSDAISGAIYDTGAGRSADIADDLSGLVDPSLLAMIARNVSPVAMRDAAVRKLKAYRQEINPEDYSDEELKQVEDTIQAVGKITLPSARAEVRVQEAAAALTAAGQARASRQLQVLQKALAKIRPGLEKLRSYVAEGSRAAQNIHKALGALERITNLQGLQASELDSTRRLLMYELQLQVTTEALTVWTGKGVPDYLLFEGWRKETKGFRKWKGQTKKETIQRREAMKDRLREFFREQSPLGSPSFIREGKEIAFASLLVKIQAGLEAIERRSRAEARRAALIRTVRSELRNLQEFMNPEELAKVQEPSVNNHSDLKRILTLAKERKQLYESVSELLTDPQKTDMLQKLKELSEIGPMRRVRDDWLLEVLREYVQVSEPTDPNPKEGRVYESYYYAVHDIGSPSLLEVVFEEGNFRLSPFSRIERIVKDIQDFRAANNALRQEMLGAPTPPRPGRAEVRGGERPSGTITFFTGDFDAFIKNIRAHFHAMELIFRSSVIVFLGTEQSVEEMRTWAEELAQELGVIKVATFEVLLRNYIQSQLLAKEQYLFDRAMELFKAAHQDRRSTSTQNGAYALVVQLGADRKQSIERVLTQLAGYRDLVAFMPASGPFVQAGEVNVPENVQVARLGREGNYRAIHVLHGQSIENATVAPTIQDDEIIGVTSKGTFDVAVRDRDQVAGVSETMLDVLEELIRAEVGLKASELIKDKGVSLEAFLANPALQKQVRNELFLAFFFMKATELDRDMIEMKVENGRLTIGVKIAGFVARLTQEFTNRAEVRKAA